MVEVSVLIVCHDARRFILDCLRGVYEYTEGIAFDVLLINNSSDGTEDLVASQYPQVKIIPTRGNIGFGPANNLLSRYALGRFVLLLNPDTIVRDNAIGKLVAFANENPKGGAWGGLTYLPDGGIDPGCCQRRITVFNMLLVAFWLGRWFPQGPARSRDMRADVPVLTGAFMLVCRDVWKILGGFDESFLLYAEEVDLCERIRGIDKRIMMTGEASIVHLVGSGESLSPTRILNMTRGRVHYARKHFGWARRHAFRVLCLVMALNRWVAGWVLSKWIGTERARALRGAYGPIWRRPASWWGGWSGAVTEKQDLVASASRGDDLDQ